MQLGGPRVARARSDADVLGSSAELGSRQSGDACELSERQKWSRLTTRSKARFYNKRGLSRLRATRHPNCQSTAYLFALRAPPPQAVHGGGGGAWGTFGRPSMHLASDRQAAAAAAGVAAPKTIWLMHEMKGRSERWSECCCTVHNQPTDRVRSEEPSSFNPSLTLPSVLSLSSVM